jgi:PleD family two-component response regulator
MMNLRVLLIESDPEYALFLQDVLTEIEAGRHWNTWVHVESLHAASGHEALALLGDLRVDLILLGLETVNSQAVDAFRRFQSAAPEVPIILLVPAEDEVPAARMIRDGAQDFLVKKQVDCAPLAHAMQNAIERQKLTVAAAAGSITDVLTGLPNRGGFLTFADRDRKIAERLKRRLMILVAEPNHIAERSSARGRQSRDLTLVEAADFLRSICGPTDLLGRIGDRRFALSIFDTEAESVEEVWARTHSAAAGFRIRLGAAIFDCDHPASLDELLQQAGQDLVPDKPAEALAMRP